MHALASCVGSAGDLDPFPAIAKSSKRRGHRVDIVASPGCAARRDAQPRDLPRRGPSLRSAGAPDSSRLVPIQPDNATRWVVPVRGRAETARNPSLHKAGPAMRGSLSALFVFLLRRWRFGLFAHLHGTHFFAIPLLATPAAAFVIDDARAASAAAGVFAHSVLHAVRRMLFHKPRRHDGRGLDNAHARQRLDAGSGGILTTARLMARHAAEAPEKAIAVTSCSVLAPSHNQRRLLSGNPSRRAVSCHQVRSIR